MKDVHIIYCLLYICCIIVLGSSDDENEEDTAAETENEIETESKSDEASNSDNVPPPSDCWMSFNAEEHYKILDEIDSRYAQTRDEVQESLLENEFDKTMIEELILQRGVALREKALHDHKEWMIPSGINLGGHSMLRMPDSVLFFHRMKLRNNTYFRVDLLHNLLDQMLLRIDLSLNDLHLKGAYERSLTDSNPSVLIYAPTFGEVEFLLKDVKYKVEGRYRLVKNRLRIEMVVGQIHVDDILMTYVSKGIESAPVKILKENLGAFESRLKTDLGKWLKDYFNDYMIFAQMDGIPHMDQLAKYDKEKGTALEAFTDHAIQAMATRIRALGADSVRLPSFTFKSFHGLEIKLYDGALNGLDNIYRRSVATGYKDGDIRVVDCIVGFSSFKALYKYEAVIPTGLPHLTGVMTLSADDVTAHMALAMVSEPETVDLNLEFLEQMTPESLTVEGAANVLIGNFKHLLEHQIVSIISNTLIHSVTMLRSLPRCDPFIPGLIKDKDLQADTDTETESSDPSSNSTSTSCEDSDTSACYVDSNSTSSSEPPDIEDVLRVKSLVKQPNRSKTATKRIRKIEREHKMDKKKNQTELKKYKRKNKKKQKINKI